MVLPVPAPATTSTGPSPQVIASRWAAFNRCVPNTCSSILRVSEVRAGLDVAEAQLRLEPEDPGHAVGLVVQGLALGAAELHERVDHQVELCAPSMALPQAGHHAVQEQD